jgi:hypothetical protein
VCFGEVKVVELVQAFAQVLKRKEIGAGRRAAFGMGLPFLLSFFFPQ